MGQQGGEFLERLKKIKFDVFNDQLMPIEIVALDAHENTTVIEALPQDEEKKP